MWLLGRVVWDFMWAKLAVMLGFVQGLFWGLGFCGVFFAFSKSGGLFRNILRILIFKREN